jgi:hypothetical protein
MLEKLKEKLNEASELLKGYKRFIDLFSDKPEGDLTRLAQTVNQLKTMVAMNELKDVCGPENEIILNQKGLLVKIKPCGDEYKDKTYLGFYLGELATTIGFCVADDKINLKYSAHNPAIFVPDLGKIIYGYESWWGYITSEKDFKEITEDEISKQWYVEMAKAMASVEHCEDCENCKTRRINGCEVADLYGICDEYEREDEVDNG